MKYLTPEDLEELSVGEMLTLAEEFAGVGAGVLEGMWFAESSKADGSEKIDGAETKWGRAKGPFQVLDVTRKPWEKRLGREIDPYTFIGGLVLAANQMKENRDRYNNDADAIRAYHGGTDKKNWGPKGESYLKTIGDYVQNTYQVTPKFAETGYPHEPEGYQGFETAEDGTEQYTLPPNTNVALWSPTEQQDPLWPPLEQPTPPEDLRKGYTPDDQDLLIERWGMMAAIANDSDDVLAFSTGVADNGTGYYEEEEKTKRINTVFNEVLTFATSPEAQDEAIQNNLAALAHYREQEDTADLEKAFVAKAIQFASENPYYQTLRLESPTFTKDLAERNIKREIAATEIEKLSYFRNQGNWAYKSLDWVGEVLQSTLGSLVVSGIRAFGGEPMTLQAMGEKILALPQDEIPGAIREISKDFENKSAYFGQDQHLVDAQLKGLFGDFADIEELRNNFTLDIALTAAGLPIFKAVSTLAKAGASSTAARGTAAAIASGSIEGTAVRSMDEAVETLLGVSVGSRASRDGLSAEVSNILDINDKALKAVSETPGVERLTSEELADAVTRTVNQAKNTYKKDQINSVNLNFDTATSTYKVDLLIGKRDGMGFHNANFAKGEMKRKGINGEIIQTDTGFHIKVTQVIDESMSNNGLQIKPVGIIRRFLQAPKAYADELLGRQGTAAAYKEAAVSSKVKEIYKANIESLPGKQFDNLNEVISDGIKNDTREWLSPKDLATEYRSRFGRDITDAEQLAYQTYAQLSDFAYSMDNLNLYKSKATRGVQSVELSFANQSFEGVVYNQIDNLKLNRVSRVYVEDTKSIDKLDPATIKRMVNEEGYTLVRPEDPSWTIDLFGEGASLILVKKSSSVKVRPLDFEQIPYVGGGRREINANFFIGQVPSGKFSDGTKYLGKPRTIRTANTVKEAEEWISKAHLAQNGLKKLETDPSALKAVNDDLIATTGKDVTYWKETFEEGGIQLDTPLTFKRNREDWHRSLEELETEGIVRMYNPEALETGFGTPNPGRLSARGDQLLKNVADEEAEVYDAMSALRRNVDRAVNAGVYTDFKISAINRFNTQFRAFVKDADRMTPYEIATKGEPSDILRTQHPDVYSAFKAQQYYINSILKTRGKWDEFVHSSIDRMAESFEGVSNGSISTSIYKNAGDPLGTIRAINFDLNLGFLNPAQFFTQANSALVGIALSPKYGLAAAKDIVAMRYALISNDVATAKHLTKNVTQAIGDGTDIERAAEQFRRMGFHSFGGNLAMMDVQSSIGATTNRMVSKANRARETGRFFFQEGERASRITAYGIARRKFAALHPDKDSYSIHADNWIREETDRLLLSPNADNNALIHKGFGAIPTQFWSYMMKLSDAMLTGAGGRYTAAERARLAGSQVLFYGAGGLPFLEYLMDSSLPEGPMDPTMYKALHNGLLDTIVFVSSGGTMDTNFSDYNSISGFYEMMLDNMIENPALALMAGATGGNLSGAWSVMQETAKNLDLIENPTPEGVTEVGLMGVVSLVKSMSLATRSAIAYNTGIWQNKHGKQIGEITKGEAVAALMGWYPQVEKDVINHAMLSKENRKKYVEDVSDAYVHLLKRYHAAETPKERDQIRETISSLGSINRNGGYQGEVAAAIRRKLGKGTFQKIAHDDIVRAMYQGRDVDLNSSVLNKEQRKEAVDYYNANRSE